MKNKIIEASEILKDKFKIKPEKSKLYLFEDIQEFLDETRNPQAQSIFFPKNLSAYVPNDRLDLVLHEYHGHGLYCEQTKYGQRMVEDENNFKHMSKKDIEFSLNLHEKQKPNFEGHALWIESFLLTELMEEEILENRERELKKLNFRNSHYPKLKTQWDVYDRIKTFEKQNGIFEMWYNLDFPRQFDKESILDIAKEKLGPRFNNLIYLINFGSQNPSSDIDLCAILEDDIKIDEYGHSNTIDMTQFNYSEFMEKFDMLEFPATEPILNGRLIYGNDNEFKKLKRDLYAKKPNGTIIKNLRKKSKLAFNYALEFYNYSTNQFVLESGLNNLAYCLSLDEAANMYSKGSSVITFNQIVNPLLSEVREYMKNSEIDKNKFNELIQKVKNEVIIC
jgi:hypothetical protein|tara:strand:- start:614 stop:1792 length:1179 start_codon:yes stop_codon:yes gene_type:complete